MQDDPAGRAFVETENAGFFGKDHEPVCVMAYQVVGNAFLYASRMDKMQFGNTEGQVVFPFGKGGDGHFFVLFFFYGYMDKFKAGAEKVPDLFEEGDGNGNAGAEVFLITGKDNAVNGVKSGMRRDYENREGQAAV
jgi:hypothetical protein